MAQSNGDSAIAKRWTVVRAIAIVAVVASMLAAWETWNALSLPIFASRPHPVLAHATAHALDGGDSDLVATLPLDAPLFAATDAAVALGGPTYRAIMRAQWPFFFALVAACTLIGYRVSGTAGATASALLSAVLPLTSMAALGLDDHLFNMALAAATVAMLPVPPKGGAARAVGAGGAAGFAFRFALVPSNGLLVMAAVLLAAAGIPLLLFSDAHWSPSAIAARLRLNRRTPEFRRAARNAGLFFAALIVSAFFRTPFNDVNWIYYSAEAATGDAATWSAHLTSYAGILARNLWGWPLAAGVAAAIAVLFRARHPWRWTLTLWIAGLTIALTFVAKKNAYYVYPAAIAAPVVAGGGLALHWKHALGKAALAAVFLGTWAWTLAGLAAGYPAAEEPHPIFREESSYRLASPVEADWRRGLHPAPRLATLLRDRRERGGPPLVVVLGTRNLMERLRYRLDVGRPRVRLFNLFISRYGAPENSDPAVMMPCDLAERAGGFAAALARMPALIRQDRTAHHEAARNVDAFVHAIAPTADRWVLIDRAQDDCVWDAP